MSRTPPVPKGEYAVGTMTYTVCNDRAETMYCNPGGSRSIPARVYYPVRKESVEGLQKAQYMSEAMCKALAKMTTETSDLSPSFLLPFFPVFFFFFSSHSFLQ